MAAHSITRLSWVLCLTAIVCAQRLSIDDTSEEDEFISGGFILPKQIFNEGKPFYVDKDPISGQLDFSSKKPAGIEPELNEVVDPKEKIILNNSAPNIHDFLNLPVKYSSSKFVYPLVSSSYANLKYQGNNKNFISNHKNHTSIVSPPPKYFATNKANITRLHPATFPHSTTDQPVRYSPTATTPATKNKYAPTKKYMTTTSTTTTVRNYVRTTNRPTTSPRPITTTTVSATSLPTTLAKSTTEEITTTSTQRLPTTTFPAVSTTTNVPSTVPLQTTTDVPAATATMTYPITTTDIPPYRPPFPLTTLPSLDAAEVYNSVGQKKDPNTMSLEDIFNVFAEDSLDSYHNQSDSSGLSDYPSQEMPASPPAPFAMHTTQRQPVDYRNPTELSPQVNPMQDANNYVHYNVQQPNTQVVNYHVPSMNNILISPDQNSTSFVIGSQQGIGSSIIVGTGEKPPTMFENGQQIHYGTVINEQLNPLQGQQGHTNAQQGLPPHIFLGQPPMQQQNFFVGHGQPSVQQAPLVQTMQQQHEQTYHELPLTKPAVEMPQTQELLVQSNIRFPAETVINGHGSPTHFNGANTISSTMPNLELQPNPVVFPKNDYSEKGSYNPNKAGGNPIVFQQNDGDTEKSEILTLNQQKLFDKKYPRLPENLTPPNPPESHKWPSAPSRLHSSTPSNKYNEFTRKPLSGLRRPNPDRPLPNILPQFRPNAKISHGHTNFNREPGNIRVPHNNAPLPTRPNGPSPPFAHRRTPIVNRFNNFNGAPEPMDNRRVYKVPPPYPQNVNRMYLQRQQRPPPPLMLTPQRPSDGFLGERHALPADPLFASESTRPERLPAFEEEDFMINDPPKPVVKKELDLPSLEPVVTLQMLKNKKRPQKPIFSGLYPDIVEEKPSALPAVQESASGQSPVYVVYPMKSGSGQFDELNNFANSGAEPVVLGQRGDQMPLLPSDTNKPPKKFEYENTPFSVVREQPQEPILMVKNKSQLNDNKDFPYPLEKPDPVFAELSKQQELQKFEQSGNIDIIPRVVNKGSASGIDNGNSPIAIAYTPTEATNYYHNHKNNNQYSKPNLASQVIPEIQTEESMNEELDTRGQHFEKDFMAPFYPSVSLSEASNSQQGWSVFSAPPSNNSLNDKNNINRIDLNEDDSRKQFNPDQFQPELQGGFKPIYPPDYKSRQTEDPESNEESSIELDETTLTAGSSVAPTTTTPTSTTTTAELETTTKRSKSKFETSLEALLFGDDEDYEDAEEDKLSDISRSS